MCDEFTAEAEKGVTRRDFGAMGAATALAACTPNGKGLAGGATLKEQVLTVTMDDGVADAFFVHPEKGRHPAILMWPDIAGLRDAFKVMARRLAGEGYAVLCVNQYYRNGPAPVLESFAGWRTPEGQAKLKPMIAAVTPEATLRDARGFAGFLDGRDVVDTRRRIGTCGYCMGGPHAVRTAAAVPARVGAAASLHGGQLVTDAPDSPHRLIAGTRASFLFAIGRNDDARSPGDKDALRQAAAAAGRDARVEVFPADHGWCVPDSPMYDAQQADAAWKAMLELFGKL